MSDSVAPEFTSYVAAARRAQGLQPSARATFEGEVMKPVFVEAGRAGELLRVAARRAAGFYRATRRSEVIWVDGESELAVDFAGVDITLADGLANVVIPVRCDETGADKVRVLFALGSAASPAGLYAAAPRRPIGPEIVVAVWGEALVAYAWHCLVELVSGIAAASGKDARGNLLVPVEMSVGSKGIEIVPMARHRFAGSSTLKPTAGKVLR